MFQKIEGRTSTSKNEFGFTSALLTSFAITLPGLFVLAAILTFMDFPEKYKTAAVLIATVLGLFISGFRLGICNEKNGMIRGALTGLTYMLILYLSSSIIFNDFILTVRSVVMIVTGILAGSIGGIVGINRKTKPLSKMRDPRKSNDLLKKYRR
ncbi:MAG TPA: TIGR04086 family membrane protein [Thermoclostridium sp.]|nr:TIGR04086 family membrane protein [Thermoclostridium sp.]